MKAPPVPQRAAAPRSATPSRPAARISPPPYGIGFVDRWRAPATTSLPASTTKHGGAGVFIQPKLIVGAVNDPLEHEADRVADEVMRIPDRELSVGAAPYLQRTIGNQAVQRLLQAELDGREAAYPTQDATGSAHDLSQAPAHSKALGTLQAKLKVDEPADVYEREADRIADPAPASVDQALAGPGQPLEPALRQDMEQGFGHDFSQVRVHTDAAAAGSAQEVNAHAYTVGRRVVFNAGKYSPGTSEGRRLIAHELTHVVQGDAATASPGIVRHRTQSHRRRSKTHSNICVIKVLHEINGKSFYMLWVWKSFSGTSLPLIGAGRRLEEEDWGR